MAHIDPDELVERERVFMARTLRQAKKVEALLSAAGIYYAVIVEPYGRSFLFGTIRHGAAFYVDGASAEDSRARLTSAGFARSVVERAPPCRE